MRPFLIAMLFAVAPLAACSSTVVTGTSGATSSSGTGGVGGSSTASTTAGAGGITINPDPKDTFPCGGSECPNGNLCLMISSGPPPGPPPGPGPGGSPCQPLPEICSGAMATCACLLQHCPCGDPTLPCDPAVVGCTQDSEGNIEVDCVYP